MTNSGDLQQEAAAEQQQAEAMLASLHPRNRQLVREVLQDHPSLTLAEALAMLRAAGM
jgi:FixJ family two-component response regulator